MSFEWPLMLVCLLLVPVLIAGYLMLMAERRASLADLGTMGLAQSTSGRRLGRRRHVPPAIFLVAIALLFASLARPSVVVGLPRQEGTVMLAFDVSSSMLADDLQPSRMEAAKAAASAFVKKQPSTIQVGIVAFGSGGLVVQQPTNGQADLLAAIDRLAPQGGTSVGEGILAALGAIAGKPVLLDDAALEGDLESVDIGYFGSAVVVVLSDGENTSSFDPLISAALAANAGVRVVTIGIGSPEGTTVEIEGYRVATALNEELLGEIAKVTGGTYFRAEDETELVKIYDTVDLKLTVRGEEMEVTSLAAGLSIVLLIAGAAFSLRWFGRMP